MTEFEFVQELKLQPDFSMNSVCRLVDKIRLKKEYLGVLRRNMMYTGLVSREGYKFTDKFVAWLIENSLKVTKLTSESFRSVDTVEDNPKRVNNWPNKNSKCAIEKEALLAKVEELGNTPGRTRELSRHFNVPQHQMLALLRKYGISVDQRGPRSNHEIAISNHETVPLSAENKTSEIESPPEKPQPIIVPVVYNNKIAHQDLLASLHELYVAKNQDYGDSFHINFTEFGILSAVIRMNDKWNRIKSLSKQPALVTEEILRDTLIDLANYSLLTVMELDRGRNE